MRRGVVGLSRRTRSPGSELNYLGNCQCGAGGLCERFIFAPFEDTLSRTCFLITVWSLHISGEEDASVIIWGAFIKFEITMDGSVSCNISSTVSAL